MALDVYGLNEDGVTYTAFSYDGANTNPLEVTFDGSYEDSQELQLFVRNDDATQWYDNVTVTPVAVSGSDDVSFEETGWGVKLKAGASQPTASEWAALAWGNAISMSNVGSASQGDTSTYYSFWVKIVSPRYALVGLKTNTVLRLTFSSNTVS
jgi:hypothetical protein